MSNLIDKAFGFWTVIGPSDRKREYKKFWVCRCACGNEQEVREDSLLNGLSTRCTSCRAKKIGDQMRKAVA